MMRGGHHSWTLPGISNRLQIDEDQVEILFRQQCKVEMIIFPCNIPNKHWFVVVVYLKQKTIVVYDSISRGYVDHHPYFVSSIFTFLHLVAIKTKQEKDYFDHKSWKFYNCSQQLPQQTGTSVDCAIFALAFIDSLLHNEMPIHGVDDMPFLRETVALSLHYREPRRLIPCRP
jgi:Ulp1 family protease